MSDNYVGTLALLLLLFTYPGWDSLSFFNLWNDFFNKFWKINSNYLFMYCLFSSVSFLSILVSHFCYNKLPPIQWLKTTHIYYLIVPEVRSPKWVLLVKIKVCKWICVFLGSWAPSLHLQSQQCYIFKYICTTQNLLPHLQGSLWLHGGTPG